MPASGRVSSIANRTAAEPGSVSVGRAIAIARSTCAASIVAGSRSSHPPMAQLASALYIRIGHALPRQHSGTSERDAQRSGHAVEPSRRITIRAIDGHRRKMNGLYRCASAPPLAGEERFLLPHLPPLLRRLRVQLLHL